MNPITEKSPSAPAPKAAPAVVLGPHSKPEEAPRGHIHKNADGSREVWDGEVWRPVKP